MSKDHVKIYTDKVKAGKYPVGKRIHLAIERHERDLERSKTRHFLMNIDLN